MYKDHGLFCVLCLLRQTFSGRDERGEKVRTLKHKFPNTRQFSSLWCCYLVARKRSRSTAATAHIPDQHMFHPPLSRTHVPPPPRRDRHTQQQQLIYQGARSFDFDTRCQMVLAKHPSAPPPQQQLRSTTAALYDCASPNDSR
jgi:hypothetical protein